MSTASSGTTIRRNAPDRSRVNRGFAFIMGGIILYECVSLFMTRQQAVTKSGLRDYINRVHDIYGTIVDVNGTADGDGNGNGDGDMAIERDTDENDVPSVASLMNHSAYSNSDWKQGNFTNPNDTQVDVGNNTKSNYSLPAMINEDQDKDAYFTTEEYRKGRAKNFNFYSWFEGNETQVAKLLPDADINGTILDFAVAGFPKCGTTSVMANLGRHAPLPVADVCTPAAQTVWYSYFNWPKEFGNNMTTMRGTKCPSVLDNGFIREYSKYLPRTKIIIGIRHPVLFFQSFWNMAAKSGQTRRMANNDPYHLTKPCYGRHCRSTCPQGQWFCVHRSRFHVFIAALGKTELTPSERQLLAPNDRDGGDRLQNLNIRNPIFVYEQDELRKDYVWDEMANYLHIEGGLKHDKYHGSKGKGSGGNHTINICDEKYDRLRAMIMPYSFDLATWLQEYFIPVARDESRVDVFVPGPDLFVEKVEEYKVDPCDRLVRMDNGTFVLNASFSNSTEQLLGSG